MPASFPRRREGTGFVDETITAVTNFERNDEKRTEETENLLRIFSCSDCLYPRTYNPVQDSC